jgi:DNA-directed RNA polymerase specialized sigma24 family protein
MSRGEQVYLWHSVEGHASDDIAHRCGVHTNTVQRRLKAVRKSLTTWTDEVSYAAAD